MIFQGKAFENRYLVEIQFKKLNFVNGGYFLTILNYIFADQTAGQAGFLNKPGNSKKVS